MDQEAELAVKKYRRLEDHHMWLLIVLVLLLLAASIMFLGKNEGLSQVVDETTSPEPSDSVFRTYTISYRNAVFSPTNLRIHAGDTVRFKNDSLLSVRVKSDDIVGFDSIGDIPPGSFFSYTFAAKGTFTYHNDKDLSESGTIIVR